MEKKTSSEKIKQLARKVALDAHELHLLCTSDYLIAKEMNDDFDVENFLSAKEAAQYLRIKIGTLYAKVEKNEIPHYRSGKRKLLFKTKELFAFIEASKQV